ncbi:16S rRNA (uracil1498-N3)-methyltransferase [Agromyces flavus]|uniref:Ribosomal RNA small subunit methyltransferase E n=1 Tax=Agromyces flavus TaxID=589382 RepID=A0A1H1S2N6_9MICO|nr:16S rRNA (uracil(1498)-N(3))-methyltransferase [Agromyces flavus]MCP2368935.1 16S rRNA (uracil1498-N3)-methyltransferase [Agromyces flavus]GGI48391.1 ribosomal RNA small subunit methyltransferase E [Agromyces flavus]SDS42143.1 16S rRNA (uracil1498-N3)-methyltransferase [Agromyces flavus]
MSSLYLDESLDLAAVGRGDAVTLLGDEARHAVTVARVRAGERVSVGDGRGRVVTGVVATAEGRRLELAVDEVCDEAEPSPRLTLVQALAKGDRDELSVQAATELGVDRIVPWSAGRSVSRWDGPKAEKGRARWSSIVREAVKQSIRAWIPPVEPVASTRELPARLAGERMLLLVPGAATPLSAIRPDGRDLALVVGPEGGMDPAEIERLREAGGEPVRLGAGVLRTSTAGPAAIAVLSVALGRW